MSKVTVVAEVIAKPGAKDKLLAELTKLIAPTRSEEGCIEYRLHRDAAKEGRFLFYENWRDQSCLDSHMASSHFKAYVAATAELVEQKNVSIMQELL